MTKPTPNVNNGHGQPEAVRLLSRHLLGIEGMSPIEIRALLDRGNHFADHPTDSTSTALQFFVSSFWGVALEKIRLPPWLAKPQKTF